MAALRMLEVGDQITMREEPRAGLPRTLALYLGREVLLYFALGFIAISTILVSQNLLRRLDEFVGMGFTWDDFGVAAGGTAVMFLAYAGPVSFLLGALLALRRFSADMEILAMRACGIGFAPLLLPVVTIGVLVSALTGYLMLEAEHKARSDLRTLLITVAARGSILHPGHFRTVGDRIVFIRERDRQNRLRGIMIAAKSGEERPYLIFAEQGRFDFDPELAMVRLRLENGSLHVEPDAENPEPYQQLSFQRLDYEIEIAGLIASGFNPSRPKHMTLPELRAVQSRALAGEHLWDLDQKNPIKYELEMHRRFALPLAPLIFSFFAVALGASRRARSRPVAILVGILVAFSYYASISFAGLMAERGWFPAPFAMWVPTVLFAALGLELLRRGHSGAAR